MKKLMTAALLLAATLSTTQYAAAGVYMCVDPVTGKKTFTDKACPTNRSGQKVKIAGESTKVKMSRNYQGSTHRNKVWNSERDRSLTGRKNFDEEDHVAVSVSGNGLLGIDS